MINKLAKILEYVWLLVVIGGVAVTIHSAITVSLGASLKYAGLTIIAVIMYLWRKNQNKKYH